MPHLDNENDDVNRDEQKRMGRDPLSCDCGGEFQVIDASDYSSTARCSECNQVYLLLGLENREGQTPILLRDWDLRRGDGPNRRSVDDRTMANAVDMALLFNEWPSIAACTDYGIKTTAHLEALKQSEVTAYELDRVIADGEAITQMVHIAAPAQYRSVKFETPFDILYSRSDRNAAASDDRTPNQAATRQADVERPQSQAQDAGAASPRSQHVGSRQERETDRDIER